VDEFEASTASFHQPAASSVIKLLAVLDTSVKAAEEYLGGLNESSALGTAAWMFRFP